MLLLQEVAAAGASALSSPLRGTIAEWVWLVPALPLLGFLINGLISLVSRSHVGPSDPDMGHAEHDDAASDAHAAAAGVAHGDDHLAPALPPGRGIVTLVGPLTVVASFALSLAIYVAMLRADSGAPFIKTLFTWMVAGDLRIDAAFQLDHLSMLMVLVVTGVGSLIHVFSIGYMRDDPGYARFFSYLNLFVFSMLVLVLGSSYTMLFFGWEGVGFCSYLLIGFWFNDQANADAGKKAFIVNRIGDFGFLIAMFMLFANLGTLDFIGVAAHADKLGFATPLVTTICLFMFLGCVGKSAQIPLYVWLPDAMAGPTPVSALIHAATMVTAGVYLIARSGFLFSMSPVACLVIAAIGALTALFAATIGLKQWDIKKVLAYSTVSQLGYMFVGVGVGAYASGIFHLVTHAFFKALLFLGAGSVIYAMHAAYHHTGSHEDAQDMRNMGGMRRFMPVTFILMWIATLAIAGIPPFSGFFSKDEILGSVFARAHESTLADASLFGIGGTTWLYAIYAVGLAGALLTAIYMTRMMLYTFHGPSRVGEEERKHLHEAPWTMTGPLVVLGILAAVGGWLNLPEILPLGPQGVLARWLEPVTGEAALRITHGAELHHALSTEYALIGAAVAIAILGIALAALTLKPATLVPKAQSRDDEGIERVLAHAWYVDEAYDATVVRPTIAVSRNVLWRGVDAGLIDGLMVHGSAWIARFAGRVGSTLQSGQVGTYAWIMLIGVVALLGAFTLR